MIPWEKVTVQAIANEPQRCVYFMIDVRWPTEPAASSNGNHENDEVEINDVSEDEGNDSDDSEPELTEFYVVPNSGDVELDISELYYVMTKFPEVQAMEDDSDDDFFDGENMDQMNINEEEDPERFADAE